MAEKLSVRVGMGAGGGTVVVIDLGRVKTDRILLAPGDALNLATGVFNASQKAYGSLGWSLDATGVTLIAKERTRQVIEEGWTAEHDDAHTLGQLARAGACYALPARLRNNEIWAAPLIDLLWPFAPDWWKPGLQHPRAYDDRIRELVKAGALIAAEIDRLLRAKARENSTDAQ